MTFAWRKDQEPLRHAELENFAHVRAHATAGGTTGATVSSAPVPAAAHSNVMEYTTVLHLRRVTFSHEGRYQCVITNHFGSSYSQKARLTVNGKARDADTPTISLHLKISPYWAYYCTILTYIFFLI